ncbi:MAG TPA: hypothetical protein VKO87_14370 [Gemmatimonadaceae bacterium]|nr:hypothetical protein [Gemmatimonadaceae bacterium]
MRARFALLAALAAASLASVAQSQGTSHYFICSTRDAGKKVGYVSSIFTDKPGDLTAVESQWKQMLTSKYGSMPFPSASCQEATTSAAAERIRDKLNDFMSDEGEKITATSWSYKPGPAAKPATTASAQKSADPDHAEEWCKYNMAEIRSLYTCPCFAKIVADHRAKYPNEILNDHGDVRPYPFQSLMGGAPSRLDGAACMTDEHIAMWVDDMMSSSTIVLKRMGKFDQAAYDARAACVRKGFKERILAEPYVDHVIAAYNLTVAACSGSRP